MTFGGHGCMDGAGLPNNQDLDDDTNINQQENASLGHFSPAETLEYNSLVLKDKSENLDVKLTVDKK